MTTPWLRTRLSVNNLLTWGALAPWQGVLSDDLIRLGFTPLQITLTWASSTVANLVSTVWIGRLADRRFAAERLMGVLSFAAAVFLFAASRATTFPVLSPLLYLAAICYVPTFPLASVVAFRHLPDPARQWPGARAWGTLGWMAGLGLLTLSRKLGVDVRGDSLLLAAVLVTLNGISSLTLPSTPPAGTRGAGGLAIALGLLRNRPFAVLTAALVGFHAFAVFFYPYVALYLVDLGARRENLPILLTLCQVAEVAVVFALPAVYSRFGAKATIATGIFTWGLRYALFAFVPPLGLALALLPLHGPGYGFTRITATIFVDRSARPEDKASVQGLVTMLWDGAAPLFGSAVSGMVLDRLTHAGVRDWTPLWGLPAVGTALVLVVFLAWFRPKPGS